MGTTTKLVNLALQGGGAHGAFTWGVLDRLLEDERMAFEGICATSAGAMNAAVMAYGLTIGGREGAKLTLATFWRRISDAAGWGPLQPSLLDRLMQTGSIEKSPAFIFFDMMTRLLSPYQFNPLNYNPLRDVLEKTIDFERLRRENVVKLFLCATNVRTGKVKIFDNDELTISAVLASGCLPLLFQAIEIDGEAYWDGGYMGNPAIFPLVYGCQSTDIIVIHINPIVRETVPRAASDILNRLNEISFNSSLMREMRAIAFANKLVNRGALRDEIKTMLIHAIEAESFMKDLGVASKYNADWDFLTHLRDVGRACAEEWLAANFRHLGARSTIDIHARYL
ncbi:patatin-like phospholipase family protein [Bradyrhizobium sp. Tv2a-2]|uniref:patatin-like phospholipase family protein n=1 Tax=Bradyrhizobium sp. Tv2a-2 TaxID=113395 RepID=UPI000465787C|nr:patatin-like phospholipase family protein [Bradyrhizobium sp. Tv2a-2]